MAGQRDSSTENIALTQDELIILLTWINAAAERYGSLYPSELRVRDKIFTALESLELKRYGEE